MKFLPSEHIIYKTKLNTDVVANRLSNILEPEKPIRFGFFGTGSTKPYEGQIIGSRFYMKRIIGYQNSFRPIIYGMISEVFEGPTIKLIMRLSDFVIAFLCIWFALVGLAFAAFLTHAFTNPKFYVAALIPLGMLLFAYALTVGEFKFEANKSKKTLESLFEAERIDY